MSALTDPVGFQLNELVETTRGMTAEEAERFLATGELPDLSIPADAQFDVPTGDVVPLDGRILDDAEVRLLLDTDTVIAAGTAREAFIFNPLQKRDRLGRWTDDISARKVLPHVRSTRDFKSEYHSDYDNAASLYQSGSGQFNHPLRESHGELLADDNVRAAAHRLDEMLAKSPAKRDVTVRRVIANPRRMFGDVWKSNGDNVGLEWTDFGYTSTSANTRFVDDFAENHVPPGEAVLLNIHVPKGVGALHMEGSNSFTDEDEVVLPRGTRFRVTADHGTDSNGMRKLSVEAVAGTAPKLPASHPWVDPPRSSDQVLSDLHKKMLDELMKGKKSS